MATSIKNAPGYDGPRPVPAEHRAPVRAARSLMKAVRPLNIEIEYSPTALQEKGSEGHFYFCLVNLEMLEEDQFISFWFDDRKLDSLRDQLEEALRDMASHLWMMADKVQKAVSA